MELFSIRIQRTFQLVSTLQSMNNQHFFICTKIKAVDINYDNNV